MLSSDVLPAPFGPMIAAICPRMTSMDTPSTARTPPKRFDALATVRCRAPRALLEPLADAPTITFVFLPLRRMRLGYGSHDADEIAIKQPNAGSCGPLRLAVAQRAWNDAPRGTRPRL